MKITELQIAVLGISGIIILEIVALYKGVDGVMFGSAMAAVGAVVGWVFKNYHSKK